MSLYLNTPLCATNFANTGVNRCYLTPKMIVGAIAIPWDKTFSAADVAAFKTTLQSLTLDDDPLARIFPIFNFEGIEDGSEEPVRETLGYGTKTPVRPGKYNFKFRYVKGGACLNKLLSGADLNSYKWLLVDSDNVVFGTINSSGLLAGLTPDFVEALPMKFNDGSKAAEFRIEFMFGIPAELNADLGFVKCDFNVGSEILGLIDIELFEVSAADGTATIRLQTLCSKTNLYDTYSTEFSGTGKALWTLNKAGTPVVITAVTANDATKDFTVTFTGTGIHTFGLVDPVTLAAATVGGYPGNGYEGVSVDIDCSGS